jgi:hypothetical protein
MLPDRLRVAWKYLASFLKKDWDLEDYPIRMRHFAVDHTQDDGRWKPGSFC